MCKLQSVFLIITIVCSHSVHSSPTGRAKSISNGKRSTMKELDPKQLESNVPTKAQEEHHLGLITDAAKDDFTENAAKQDEIGYLRSFHKKGNGGYDKYEAFHNKDNAEYEHEDHEHVDKEDKQKKSLKDASNGHATESSSDDDYEDYDEDAAIDKQLQYILQEDQTQEQEKPIRIPKKKSSEKQKESVRPLSERTRKNPEEIGYEKETIVTTATGLDNSEPTKLTFNEEIPENKIRPKLKAGYEVHEIPDEIEKDFNQKGTKFNRQFAQGTATNHRKPHKYYTKSAKGRPSGGGYEAFIVHDEEDENDLKEHDLGGKDRHSLINSHYPTFGINHNKKASKEKNYDKHADYNEAEEEAELSDEDENFAAVKPENLSPTGPTSSGEEIHEQTDDEDEVEDSNDDIDYDDDTPQPQKKSNYEDYTNDNNEDYDYTDRKIAAKSTAFKQAEMSHKNDPEYDYEYYDEGDADDEKRKNIQTNSETYAKFPSRDKENDDDYNIAYDYGNEQVQEAEDEYD